MARRLYRSRDAMIGGVCAGLAEYFDVDPSLIRLVAVLLLFAGGVSLLAYVIAWIIIPREPTTADSTDPEKTANAVASEVEQWRQEFRRRPRVVLGAALIVIGLLLLLSNLNFWPWFSLARLWPVILIAIGILIITRGMEGSDAAKD